MEKKMENEMETLGPFKGVYRDTFYDKQPQGLDVFGCLGFRLRGLVLIA